MKKFMSKARRVASLVVILATIMSLLAMTVFASTATPTTQAVGRDVTVYKGSQQPYDQYDMWAGAFLTRIDPGGYPRLAYCTELEQAWCRNQPNIQGPDIDTANWRSVVWILHHYYPNTSEPSGPSGWTNREKAAAVQWAIWYFIENVRMDIGTPDDIRTVAQAIVAAATGQSELVPQTPTTITLAPSSDSNPVGFLHTVTATLLDQNDDPLSGKTVIFTVTGVNPTSGSAVTNDSGQTTFTYTGSITGTDTITATVTYTVPLGLRWISTGCQDLIMAQEAPGQVSASATKEWVTVTNPGSIGNFVWDDGPNPDHIQTGNENKGLNDIRMYLYEDEDGDGVIDSGDDLLSTLTTANNPATNKPGWYLFTNLPAGNYIVKVDDEDMADQYLLLPVDQYVGGDDTNDSNGPTSTPWTEKVNLGEGENNLTIDFGYTSSPTAITLSSFAAKSNAGASASWLWLGLAGLTVLAAGSLFWAKRRAG